ncbi:MAG TPA: glycosyltransferase [Rheinheimera sp.]|nr:glycosyltransferase [Rheinheimera sp.]
MKKLRVLHVTFDMAIGGTEQVIRQLVLNLPSTEFTNEIFCIDGKVGAVGEALAATGISIHQAARRGGLDKTLIRTLRQTIREGQFDVVHCHQYTPWVYGWFAAWGTKAKVIFTEHGRFFPDRYRGKALPLNVLMALTTSAITAISSATRDALAKYEWVPKFKVKVVYNGIQPLHPDTTHVSALRQELNIEPHHLVLGTVARLDPVKNQSMMLRAFANVVAEYPDARLIIVGDGPSRQQLEALAKELAIHHRIVFTGFRTNVADYLALIQIYLLSSHTEGTSMTLLEAMHLGLPCVATAVGGNPEIVLHGQTGLLSPDDDAETFARCIKRLLASVAESQQFGRNGMARFNEFFSVEQMVMQYRSLYFKATDDE